MAKNDDSNTIDFAKNNEDLLAYLAENVSPAEPISFQVRRVVPSSGEFHGYLGLMYIDHDNLDILEESIRENWGGGTFTVQPRIRKPGGGAKFSRSFTLRPITGAPHHRRETTIAPQALQSPGVSPPAQMGPQNDLANVLQTLVEAIIPRLMPAQHQAAPRQAIDVLGGVDVGGIISALGSAFRQLQQPPPRSSSGELDSLERAIKLISMVRGEHGSIEAPSESGLAGILREVAPTLRVLFSPPQPAPPPPGTRPLQRTPNPAPAPQPRPPEQGTPPSHTMPAPPPGWMLSDDGTEWIEEEKEPWTADEMFDEIGQMSPEEQQRLAAKFGA